MSKKKKVLQNHKQKGKKIIPPFVDTFKNFKPISWETNTIPEIIWIALAINHLGERIGIDFLIEISSKVYRSNDKLQNYSFLFLSNYELLTNNEKEKTLDNWINGGLIKEIENQFSDFVRIYPECPISFAVDSKNEDKTINEILEDYKEVLNLLLDRMSKLSMIAATTAIYNHFVNGKLYITKDSKLTEIEKIMDYPKTEESKIVASIVRTSIKMLHNPELFNINSEWPTYFWNRGYQLEPWKI